MGWFGRTCTGAEVNSRCYLFQHAVLPFGNGLTLSALLLATFYHAGDSRYGNAKGVPLFMVARDHRTFNCYQDIPADYLFGSIEENYQFDRFEEGFAELGPRNYQGRATERFFEEYRLDLESARYAMLNSLVREEWDSLTSSRENVHGKVYSFRELVASIEVDVELLGPLGPSHQPSEHSVQEWHQRFPPDVEGVDHEQEGQDEQGEQQEQEGQVEQEAGQEEGG